jgi:hypothetical protein
VNRAVIDLLEFLIISISLFHELTDSPLFLLRAAMPLEPGQWQPGMKVG